MLDAPRDEGRDASPRRPEVVRPMGVAMRRSERTENDAACDVPVISEKSRRAACLPRQGRGSGYYLIKAGWPYRPIGSNGVGSDDPAWRDISYPPTGLSYCVIVYYVSP